jgi:MtN3 and saliva related transmembrane protein
MQTVIFPTQTTRRGFKLWPVRHLFSGGRIIEPFLQLHQAAMTSTDILGLVATCFTTSSFVPQVWRTWKTRDVSGISLATYLVITVGLALWLVYGFVRGDLPLIVANSVMVILTGSITVMKLKFAVPVK